MIILPPIWIKKSVPLIIITIIIIKQEDKFVIKKEELKFIKKLINLHHQNNFLFLQSKQILKNL